MTAAGPGLVYMEKTMSGIRQRVIGAMLLLLCGPLAAAELDGVLHWLHRAELTTPVSGVISDVLVGPGERTTKGQVLLKLDARGFRADVARARAELNRLSMVRDEAQRELERAEEMFDRTLLSLHDLELARIAYASADAEYRKAQAALTQARLNVEYSVIKAPFDGVVLWRDAEPGETVVTRLQTKPLLAVAETSRMLARVLVLGDQLSKLKLGAEASVSVGGRRYAAKVQHIAFEPDAGEGKYPVDVLFEPAEGHGLRAGQSAKVTLP